ncbi:AVN_HP_G0120010.mRNA.1.CDS.1 [Saccharomyces cerevisiae]|nr:AVN_HP_G0120010.mRNA.1.CDS.1 [Saccharomyces cerevisiae]CAI6997106.1 AVN_HP_G0120010.mRNA.1.CDS.1 [Saccharomyces cerevisiae]
MTMRAVETVYTKKSASTWEATKNIEKTLQHRFNDLGVDFQLKSPFAIQHVWWFEVSLLVTIFTWSPTICLNKKSKRR